MVVWELLLHSDGVKQVNDANLEYMTLLDCF